MAHTPGEEDDAAPPRARWVGWLLALFMLAVVLGLLHIGWRIMQQSG